MVVHCCVAEEFDTLLKPVRSLELEMTNSKEHVTWLLTFDLRTRNAESTSGTWTCLALIYGEEVTIDVRVIAATSSFLDDEVRQGRFREDLFYRLDVLRLELPPLKKRPEDIVFLFAHFARKYADDYNVERPELNDAFLENLVRFDWPGNVRQLQNFTERLTLTHCGQRVDSPDFFSLLLSQDSSSESWRSQNGRSARKSTTSADSVIDTNITLEQALNPKIAELEHQYLCACLRVSHGNIGVAAEIAGIGRRTMTRKLKQYDIDKADFKAFAKPVKRT